MEKVTLPTSARKTLEAKLEGRKIPDPNSQEFDDLLEELRELNPEIYTELQASLEYKSDPLPVEHEAKLAGRRAKRQAFRDKLTNRQTHDNKTVPDKRKLFIVGSSLAMALFGWMTWSTAIAPLLFGRGSAGAQQPEETPSETQQPAPTQQATPPEQGFGITAPRAQLASLTIPNAVPTSDLPPQKPPEARAQTPTNTPPSRSTTDLPPRSTNDIPPEPTPITRQAQNVPTSPYQPPSATETPATSDSAPTTATPEALPNTLSFETSDEVGQLPTTLSSQSTPIQADATLSSVPLSRAEEQARNTPAASTTLSSTSGTPSKSTLNTSLSWEADQPAQPDVQLTSTSVPLPAVPDVGQTPPAAGAQRQARPQRQPINLQQALQAGTELKAELITAVAASGTQGTPVLAKTTGNWCKNAPCPDITWIGEATYDGTDRVNITFAEAVVSNNQQSVTATAFGDDRLPGLIANVGDGAPTAVQDLLRSSVGGASDYLNAINTRTTTTIEDGVIVQEQAEPDLGNVLLGRAANLFALPADQTSVVRYATLPDGQPLTVMFGISL